MKLLSCHIDNFGILSNFDYEFKSGLNVFHEENGFGKTTFMTFIKAMFYGLKPKERKQFFPWQGGDFGGILTFNLDNEVFTIKRIFNADESKDVVELTSKNGETLKAGQIGSKIFGLNADVFERTAYLMERGDSVAYDKVRNNLASIIESGEDAKYYDRAISSLMEELSRLEGKKGEIANLNAQLNKVENKIKAAEEVETAFIENSAILESADAEIIDKKQAVKDAEQAKIDFYEQNAFLSAVKAYSDMLNRVEEKETTLAEELRFFNGNVIEKQETDEYYALNDEIKELEFELKALRKDKDKLCGDKVLNASAFNESKIVILKDSVERKEKKVYNMAVNDDEKLSFTVENEKYDASISGEQLKRNQAIKNRLTTIQQNRFIPKYKTETEATQFYVPNKKVTPAEALEKVSPDLRKKYADSLLEQAAEKKVEPPTIRPDVEKLKQKIIARQTTVTTSVSAEEGAKTPRPNWLVGVPPPGLMGKTAVAKIDEGTLKLRKENFALHSSVNGIKKLIRYFAFGLFGIIALSVLFSILSLLDAIPAAFTITMLSIFIFMAAAILAIFIILIFEIKKKKAEIAIIDEKIKVIAGEITKNYETITKVDTSKTIELLIESRKKETPEEKPIDFIPQPLIDNEPINEVEPQVTLMNNEVTLPQEDANLSRINNLSIGSVLETKNDTPAFENNRAFTQDIDESNPETEEFKKLVEQNFVSKKANTGDILSRLSLLSKTAKYSQKAEAPREFTVDNTANNLSQTSALSSGYTDTVFSNFESEKINNLTEEISEKTDVNNETAATVLTDYTVQTTNNFAPIKAEENSLVLREETAQNNEQKNIEFFNNSSLEFGNERPQEIKNTQLNNDSSFAHDSLSDDAFARLEAQNKAFNDELILLNQKLETERALKLTELEEKEAELTAKINAKIAKFNLFAERFNFGDKKPKNNAQILSEIVSHFDRFNMITNDIDELNKSAEKFRIEEGITSADLEKTEQGAEKEAELDFALEKAKQELNSLIEKKAVASDFVKKYFKKPPQLDKFRMEKSHLDFEISCRRNRAEEIKATAHSLKEAKEKLLAKHLPKAKEEFTSLVTSMLNFEDVVLDDALNIKILDKGCLRELSSYSEGYKTIFDFCRRVALSKLVFSQTDGFLIMDDPFVMLDERHFVEATDVLNSLAKTTQIIYFTCHKTRTL